MQLPQSGYMVNIETQSNLSYRTMQEVLCYNIAYLDYVTDNYIDDPGSFFTGVVNDYDPISGALSLIVNYSSGYGLTSNDGSVPTYSTWNIVISPPSYSNNIIINDPIVNGLVTSDGTLNNLNVNQNLLFDGNTLQIKATTQFQQTIEIVNSSTASSIVVYDYNLGSIWYHNDIVNNYTAEFVNVPTIDKMAITSTIIIRQGNTASMISSLYINGDQYSIKWANGISPSGNTNSTDVIGLSFINFNTNFIEIIAQISNYS